MADLSGWVSVEDRLPELKGNSMSEKVLAYNGNFFLAMVDYSRDCEWIETTDFDWLGRVTHWMPLPEPPCTTPSS